MSFPRIIQNNGQSLYLRAYNPGGGGSGINQLTGDVLAGPGTGSVNALLATIIAGGTFGDATHALQLVVDNKGRITGITPFGIPGITPTCMPKASDLGILANGSDQTSALNTAFANSSYAGIIMDYSAPGAVTISGTVNCQGKMIFYWQGNTFTGAGTLNNHVVAAGYNQKLWDITVSLTNTKTTSNYFSIKWFGATGNGSTDDTAALQKSSDTVISNTTMTRDLYMVAGNYKITDTWQLYNWNGVQYDQWTVNVIGDWKLANSNLAGFARVIATSLADRPAINVQRATSGSITGISVEGPYTYSAPYNTFVNTTFAATKGSLRTSQYSPSAGIMIDGFTNGVTPADGGYPAFNGSGGGTNWYRGTGSNGGSTDFLIRDCSIHGFTVDICNSPNGSTQQGEDCKIENCRLEFCQVAVGYYQSQSDNCKIINCRSWNTVWNVIDTRLYSGGQGLPANIDGYNVAGSVYSLFNVASNKGFSIQNFYAESFFTIGTLNAVSGGGSLNGTFDFGLGDDGLSSFQPQFHLQMQNFRVWGSSMRYFDDQFNKRIRIGTPKNCIIENSWFDTPPLIVAQADQQVNTVRFINCPTNNNTNILGMNSDMYGLSLGGVRPIPYGTFRLQDGFGSDDGSIPTVSYNYNNSTFNRFHQDFGSAVITPDGSRSATFTASIGTFARVNDYILDYVTRNVIGRISNISGTTITIVEIPVNITTATYLLSVGYYIVGSANVVGDIATSSPVITNVCPLISGQYPNVGFRYDHPAFPQGTYVVSVDTGLHTITLSVNSNVNAIRQNFMNGNPRVEISSIFDPSSSAFTSYANCIPTGTRWTQPVTSASSSAFRDTVYVFSKGGFLPVATSPGAAYDAEFAVEPPTRESSGNYQWYGNVSDTWTTL